MIERFAEAAAAAGFVVHRGEPPALPDASVSRALYGLADTGSVVLAASPGEPRARSLLAPVHLSLLAEDRILPDLAALFAVIGADLPSALAIVTGPSRSADIEQRLVVGVHGPGEEHVALLPPGRARSYGSVAARLPASGRRAARQPVAGTEAGASLRRVAHAQRVR